MTHRLAAAEPAERSAPIEPKTFDYKPFAFYPDRWEKMNVDFEMLAWEGNQVVFLTKKGNYDERQITEFVGRLDGGWSTYADLIGEQPRPIRVINQKPTVCALPHGNLSCGYGCGYVGGTGIEASAFYSVDLPAFTKQPNSFQHYYFYEMGRNYFVFGDRHSLFTTGYAVFMRYVCMDRLGCRDLDANTRQTIEGCEEIYAKSKIPFFDAFTNLGSGEKRNRLKDNQGQPIQPSDQPVMYATAMLKLRRDHGGDRWVKRFYHSLRRCEPVQANDLTKAKTQVFNWLVCASFAAGEDLSTTFVDRWRLPMSTKQRDLMKQADWAEDDFDVKQLVSQLVQNP